MGKKVGKKEMGKKGRAIRAMGAIWAIRAMRAMGARRKILSNISLSTINRNLNTMPSLTIY